jgi:hypothetical protein
MKRTLWALGPAAAGMLVAVPSPAQEAPGREFGHKGQLAMQADLQLSFEGRSVDNGGSSTTLVVQPAADYFVIDHLSVGGLVGLDITSDSPQQGPGTTVTTFSVGPRVGYDIPLTDAISFWPDVFLAYSNSTFSNNGRSNSSAAVTIGAFAPFLFHPVTYFFLGLGPNVSTDLSRDNGGKVTSYGIMSTIGGWIQL